MLNRHTFFQSICILALFFVGLPTFAQLVDTAWVRRHNGSENSFDGASAVVADDSGNVYVTGWIHDSGTAWDYFTVKYYPNGDTAWVRKYNGPVNGDDAPRAIALDGSGNIYVTGESYGSGTADDYATIKYYPDGGTAWVARYNGPVSGDEPRGIAVDYSGNVYVAGWSYGGGTNYDYATIKYHPNGDTAWVRRYNGPGNADDGANALAVDDSGNVYVTGHSWGIGTIHDYATIKYHPNGDTAWMRRYIGLGSSDEVPNALAIDDSGNVYVTGYSDASGTMDFATVKYYPNGDEAWVAIYNGPGDSTDVATAIAVDHSGNVYVTGYSPGSTTEDDYATIKYYSNGDTAWVRRYDGAGSGGDVAHDIAVDGSGNVYVTGDSHTNGNKDYGTVKYYPNGNMAWVAKYNGPGDMEDEANALAVDDSEYVYVAGTSKGSETYYDFTTVKYIQYDSIPFAPAVNYEAAGPSSVFCGDLDGDLDLDLAVTNFWNNTVSILTNDSDGVLELDSTYAVMSLYPISVFGADLDGDSNLDLAVASQCEDSTSILLSNGDGTFQSAVGYVTHTGPYSVYCADLDGDSDRDIAVANYQHGSVSILKNNGDGTFELSEDYMIGRFTLSVFCADLNGDSSLDLAVANAESATVSVLINNGDGTFQPRIDHGTGSYSCCVFCADLDGDKDMDMVVADSIADSVSVLMNSGNGSFQNAVNYETEAGPRFVFCADLDGDEDLDLAVANSDANNISIFRNNGDGIFQPRVNYEAGGAPLGLFCADLDGDLDLDLAVANWGSNSVSILKNLTQLPANQPPWAFSLISPTDGDTTFGSTTFRWQTPYDPNFGDQIRYDLYVSTDPGFDPGFTVVYDSLPLSRFTDTLDTDTYYWKVRAYDNWGAGTWSTETLSFTTFLALPLALDSGWQYVSTNIDPQPSEMETVFVDCWTGHMDIIEAGSGDFCIPDIDCWIPGWNVKEMYKIHMADECTIQIRGSKAPTETEIPLSEGWNHIAYLPECPLEPETALVSIWDNLDIVKMDIGLFCIPGVVCDIECMEYNEGYKVHLSASDTLTYPTGCPPCPPLFAKRVNSLRFDGTSNQKTHPQCETPEHFVFRDNTGESYSVVVDSAFLDSLELEECDEIGVFADTGSAKGLLCVGASVYHPSDLPVPLVAWKDDPFTPEQDGYTAGDTMYFKIWSRNQEREEYASSYYEQGDGQFETGIFSKLWLEAPVSGPPDFGMEARPDSQEIQAGDSTDYEVILTPLHGFASSCTLTITDLPEDVSARFNPDVLVPKDSSVLTVRTSYTTPPGVYTLTIVGTEMGGKGAQQSTEVILAVTPGPDFTMEAAPDTQEIQVGNSADFDVRLTALYGFASSCTLTVSGLPPDVSAGFDPVVVVPTDSSILEVNTEYTTPPGTYNLTITATELGKAQIEHSIDVTLVLLHSDTLWVTAYSPVDLIVTDPVGDSIGLEFNTILDAIYDTTVDVNEDEDMDDLVTIPHALVGEYLIRVIAEPNAEPGDSYSVGIRIDGSMEVLLAENAPVPPPGESDIFGYGCLPYLRGDLDQDNQTTLGDVLFLVNYLYKGGPAPDPVELADLNCDELVDLGDLLYLIAYLYKGGPPPCS